MPATEHFFRDQKKLHLIFAISCVVMLVSVILMMIQDYSDPWRQYQSQNFRLQAAAKERDIRQIETDDFRNALSEQKAELNRFEDGLKSIADLREQVARQRDAAVRNVEALELQLKNENAVRDEYRADLDLGIRDGLPQSELDSLKSRFDSIQATANQTQLLLEDARQVLKDVGNPDKAESPELKAQLVQLRDDEKKISDKKKEIEKSQADLILLENSLKQIKPTDPWMKAKRAFMELPIVDGFNGPLKVTQDWLPDLHQTLGMTEIARFDRCRTCHMNVDRTAPGNLPAFPHGQPSDPKNEESWVAEGRFPHPFATHPNHDLFVTASSPHPVATFGCTACHDGQGSGTTFGNAEHTPNDPHQSEDWHHEFGYHPNHFWEYPMQPARFAESTCIKCHHDVVDLVNHPKFGDAAPKVVKGYNLIRKYGCFGCHEMHGFDGGKAIGPDLRLEPQTAEQQQRIAEDPTQVAGKFRKVGPSLRYIAAKTSAEFIAHWTEIPQRFRPSTKMPQFFQLSNQQDAQAKAYQQAELAGIATVLIKDSEKIDLLKPAEGYKPDAERGEQLFAERGCLACHTHGKFEGSTADFGPNISDIHKKVNRNEGDTSFSDWLYTWIREPARHHKRTRMPNLYLDSYESGEDQIDPAADITAFLLSQGDAEQFPAMEPADTAIDELIELYLKKARFSDEAAKNIVSSGIFPLAADKASGDEKVLAGDGQTALSSDEWHDRKLEYLGRKTVARYGCYGCHDVPGYEEARPIGVALQDWGRKDTSKLGLEHVEEFLHHHGETSSANYEDPLGTSTLHRVEEAMAMAADGTVDHDVLEPELTQAYFYDSLIHHGRPGFIWQKLRGPRTYDYMKVETKGYDERLRMPKFPLKEDEVEAIATFVLGLVAEPPAEKYVYTPSVREQTRIDGEFLLAKYNCTGCHMVELPKITFGINLEEDVLAPPLTDADHPYAKELLLQMRRPKTALTGGHGKFMVDGEEVELPVASFHGIRMVAPDMEEEDPELRETGFDTWETLDFGRESDPVLPATRITIPETKLVSYEPARGGDFAEWLVTRLAETRTEGNVNLAWQSSPPPLYQEGFKVQTSWLYQFLLEPEKLRHTTVLRMPRFNMSTEEAQTLANYFAAVDGAEFPYQELPQTNPDFIAAQEQQLAAAGLMPEGHEYLGDSWKLLNGPLCVKCHSLGGRKFKVSDPKKDIQGPNLNRVQSRLRADWLKMWIYNPRWITPYTSMPVNFPKNQKQFPDLFGGDAQQQIEAAAAGLMNYSRLMEDIGPTVYTPPGGDSAAGGAGATPEGSALDK
ncbi:MAG: c-type cytochrome [Planctomycetaceae bacterium]